MTALQQIRRLYYAATRSTIERDFQRAIDLLKSMPDEAARERATVYMQGLAEMRKDWSRTPPPRHRSRPRRRNQ
jgi:hypothetical protein